VPDQDGLRLFAGVGTNGTLSPEVAVVGCPGYEGRGKRWAEEVLKLSIEIVRKPKKPLPEDVAKIWAEGWAKEGEKVDWQRLMPQRGFKVLPRGWVVERTFSWLSQNRGG
jgi:hypothetical protein